MIRLSILIFSALLVHSTLDVQECKITPDRETKLLLENFSNDVHVEGSDGNEIIVCRITQNAIHDHSDGSLSSVSPLTTQGIKDNTGIGLHMAKDGKTIILSCISNYYPSMGYLIKMPKKFSLEIKNDCNISRDIVVQNILNDVEINNCQSILLRDISGSIILSAVTGSITIQNGILKKGETLSLVEISGNIHAQLNRVETNEPLVIHSISGNIVLALPLTLSASFTLETVTGKIQSAFPFSDASKNTNQEAGTKIRFEEGKKQCDIQISTVSGNITLKKNK